MVRKRSKIIVLLATSFAIACVLLAFQSFSMPVHISSPQYLEREPPSSSLNQYLVSDNSNSATIIVHRVSSDDASDAMDARDANNASSVMRIVSASSTSSSAASKLLPVTDHRLSTLDEMFNHLSSITAPKSKTIAEMLDERTAGRRTDQFSYYSNQEFELTKKFLIDQPFYCGKNLGKNVDLIVVVMSAVYKFTQRDAIRKTWGRVVSERGLRLLFFVGKSEQLHIDALIAKENAVNKDIIQAAFVDHYYNNTLKAISILQSLKMYCPKVRYVLKSDDDMLLNVQIAIDFARLNYNVRKTIFGLIYKNAAVNRSKTSKWFVPKYVFPYVRYPAYATGAVYMFTGDAIGPLLSESTKQNSFYVDDVFITGIVAQKVGVKRIQANNFVKLHYANKLDTWTFASYLGTHGYDAPLLKQRWSAIHRHIACH